jgi:metal-responsive CopG/Arc/MetJ family transcriptional regulator
MATRSRTISLPEELADRIDAMPRAELPNLSQLVAKLLTRELDRRDAVRARKAGKG